MHGVARKFFILAMVYALAGMALGIVMAISQDHTQMPVHAHTMVAGWLMSSVFAFFYHLFPERGATRLATVHFWLQSVTGIVLLVSLYLLLGGNAAAEPVTGAASLGFYAGMLLFGWIALPVVTGPAVEQQRRSN